ncbi:MAG: M23 family metallopeptidase, partial [Arenimonas sp.]
MRADRRLALVIALLVLGQRPGVAHVGASPMSTPSFLRASVPQGALVRLRVSPGSRVSLLGAAPGAPPLALRVGPQGDVVFGIGRDEIGPMQLSIATPGHALTRQTIVVVKRIWKIERVQGVPESTVNPPAGIAARITREQAEVAAARQRDDDRDDFAGEFILPLEGRVSGLYGSQRVYNGTAKSPHSGLDIAAGQGTPIHAPTGGVVSFAKPDLYLTGGTVLLDHGHGVSSNFLHLSRIDVAVGDRVEQGQVIGLVGATGRATGPHMHWGMNW